MVKHLSRTFKNLKQDGFRCLLLLLAITIVNSASGKPNDVLFPRLSSLDTLWVDGSGNYFSAIQRVNGELALHNSRTGEFFYYWLEGSRLSKRPSHAPAIDYAGGQLYLDGEALNRARVKIEEVEFKVGDVVLYGILTLPASNKPVPLIINSHGSGKSAASQYDWTAAWYTQAGYATFIFDKRGTGQSEGSYTHNFNRLAADLNAAQKALSVHPAIDNTRVGLAGYSQGVYVATLAASLNPEIAFIIASFGMTESPLEEDVQETELLFAAHYPQFLWSEFEPFVRACGRAFALRENEFWKTVNEMKTLWKNRLKSKDFAGTLSGDGCLAWPAFILRTVGRSQFPQGLLWSYDPQAAMAALKVPVLWQFGEADTEAPSQSSITQVNHWIKAGLPFDLITYPNAEHGIYLEARDERGESYFYKDPDYIQDMLRWLEIVKLQSP